jgi:ESAT-6 family protein
MNPSYGADGQIAYNFGEIRDVAHSIIQYEGAMDGALEHLYRDFRDMFHAPTDGSEWKGAAADACNLAQQHWQGGVNEIKDSLKRLGNALHSSVDNMEGLENSIASGM